MFHDRSLLERCFRGFVLPVLEYCSAVWCSAADTLLKLLDRAVSGARFLTGGVFECDISHHRSVAVLCMLYKIRCNPVHPLNDALPGKYVPARVTRGALLGTLMHRLAADPCGTAGLLFASRCSSGTILLTPCSMVWDWRVSRAGSMLLYWLKLLFPYYMSSTIFPFLFFLSAGWCCMAGVFGLIGCISLSLSLAVPTFLNNNNNIARLACARYASYRYSIYNINVSALLYL